MGDHGNEPVLVLSKYSAEPESGQFYSAAVAAVTVSARIVISGVRRDPKSRFAC